MSENIAVIGTGFGDEGKGKIIDYLAPNYDIVARAQGGSNAGHTVYVDGKKHVSHLIPIGILHEKISIVGNGVVINPDSFLDELKALRGISASVNLDLLKISRTAHVTLPLHCDRDRRYFSQLGTTKRGIGPTYADKANRLGIRVSDLYSHDLYEKIKRLYEYYVVSDPYNDYLISVKAARDMLCSFGHAIAPYVCDTVDYLNRCLDDGASVLFEGAQATGLDIDHGTYPYCTSSNCTTSGILHGLGISHKRLNRVVGVVKAFTTRVDNNCNSPFSSEMLGEEEALANQLRSFAGEYGATTGRPRRIGWLDLELVKASCVINGIDELALTKIDSLSIFEKIKVRNVDGTMQVLPGPAATISYSLNYLVHHIEEQLGIPVRYIGVGPHREDIIVR